MPDNRKHVEGGRGGGVEVKAGGRLSRGQNRQQENGNQTERGECGSEGAEGDSFAEMRGVLSCDSCSLKDVDVVAETLSGETSAPFPGEEKV